MAANNGPFLYKKVCYGIIALLFVTLSMPRALAQKSCLSAEGAIGRIIPNYSTNYPRVTMRADGIISWRALTDSTSVWANYYNYPEAGISFQAASLGNRRVFGHQYSVYPFISFRLSNKRKPMYFKAAIGTAFTTRPYNGATNTNNLSIGSVVTWHFNICLAKTVLILPRAEFRVSGGFYHTSNGHGQIPNFGLNSALLGLEVLIKKDHPRSIKVKNPAAPSYWVIEARSGAGFHELAGAIKPIGTPKYSIMSVGINAGYVFRQHIKYKFGFAARYYNSYNNYLRSAGRSTNILGSSGINLMTGAEFLMGHFGIDIELGFYLYRPFFKEFYSTFEHPDLGADYWLKRIISTRLGLNYYLLSCYKPHAFNVKIGAHINANSGQADYSDVSLGITYRFKK